MLHLLGHGMGLVLDDLKRDRQAEKDKAGLLSMQAVEIAQVDTAVWVK